MRRTAMPARRTGMVRRTPLRARRTLERKVALRPARVVGMAPGVTDVVLDRDQHSCVHCGSNLFGVRGEHWSIQHRRRRGSGGDPRPQTHLPANLLSVCGSGTTGCHGWIEEHPWAAGELGLRIHPEAIPARCPVATWYGRVLLDNAGGFRLLPVDELPEVA